MPTTCTFTVDNEFRSLIPPPSPEELRQLEENLVSEGCREALVVWRERGILLDGHNRFDICGRLGIEYEVREISLADRTAAMVWIIRNQTGRRNLDTSQKAMLAGRLANLQQGGDRKSDDFKTENSGLIQEEAANLFGVSVDSVGFARKVLISGSDNLKAAVDRGDVAVSTAAEIATLPKEEQAAVVAKGEAEILRKAKEIKRGRAKARVEKRAEQKAAAVGKNHPLKGKAFHLICGDLLDVGAEIADASVDAIITDPPYPEEFLPVYDKLAELAARVLVDGGHCLVMVGQSHLPDVIARLCCFDSIRYQWALAYLTPGQSTQVFGRKVKSNWKPVIWLVKGKNTWEHVEDTIKSDENDKRFHEWGQSVGGIAQIIDRFTVPKATILDPFVGGGSTAEAALRLDRLFIGIDIDKACIQETASRIMDIGTN